MRNKLNTVAHWMELANNAADELTVAYLALERIASGKLGKKAARKLAKRTVKKLV